MSVESSVVGAAEIIALQKSCEPLAGVEEFEFLLAEYAGRELMIASNSWVNGDSIETLAPAAECVLKAWVETSQGELVSVLSDLFSAGLSGQVDNVSADSFSVLEYVVEDCFELWID